MKKLIQGQQGVILVRLRNKQKIDQAKSTKRLKQLLLKKE